MAPVDTECPSIVTTPSLATSIDNAWFFQFYLASSHHTTQCPTSRHQLCFKITKAHETTIPSTSACPSWYPSNSYCGYSRTKYTWPRTVRRFLNASNCTHNIQYIVALNRYAAKAAGTLDPAKIKVEGQGGDSHRDIWPSTLRYCMIQATMRPIHYTACKLGSATFPPTNTFLQSKTDTDERESIRLPILLIQYVFTVHFNNSQKDVASSFGNPTNCLRPAIGSSLIASLGVALLFNMGAVRSQFKKKASTPAWKDSVQWFRAK